MKRYVYIICICMILLLSSCQKAPEDVINMEGDIRELWITNETSLFFNSIDVRDDSEEENALVSPSVDINETAKFSIPEGITSATITLNPKDAYSISEKVNLDFGDDEVIKYKVVVEKNIVTLVKLDNHEK